MIKFLFKVKTCFKCGKRKPRAEFYRHSAMADGLLGKCKVCTRGDSKARRERKLLEPAWVAQERARCRVKQNNYRKSGRALQPSRTVKARWRRKNRHKANANLQAARACRKGLLVQPPVCQCCGQPAPRLDKHHPDYSKPLEVLWLCPPCHGLTRRKL